MNKSKPENTMEQVALKLSDLNSEMSKIKLSVRDISNLGFEIRNNGSLGFKFNECDYIAQAVCKLEEDYFGLIEVDFKWNGETKIALQLAEAQEIRNDFLNEHEIRMVNKFFGVNVTRSMISKVGSYFI